MCLGRKPPKPPVAPPQPLAPPEPLEVGAPSEKTKKRRLGTKQLRRGGTGLQVKGTQSAGTTSSGLRIN